MKPSSIKSIQKPIHITLDKSIPTRMIRDGRILAEIQKNHLPGSIAKLKISTQWITAKVGMKLFAHESILLEKKENPNEIWSILKRTISLQTKGSQLEKLNLSIDSKLPEFRDSNILETIEKYFHNSQNHELGTTQEKLLKTLSQLFSFFQWDQNVEMFTWKWNDSESEGYFQDEEQNKIFLLEYNSKFYGKSRYLFSFAKNDSNWDFFSQFENNDFYEIFLEGLEDLKQYFRDAEILPKTIIAEYVAPKLVEEKRGWIV
jgi:hypothetical protein